MERYLILVTLIDNFKVYTFTYTTTIFLAICFSFLILTYQFLVINKRVFKAYTYIKARNAYMYYIQVADSI